MDGEMKAINSFHGDYRYLSNFYPSPVSVVDQVIGGVIYGTVEHFYQAQKNLKEEDRLHIYHKCLTPGQAKRYGKTVTLRSDWEEVKFEVMRLGLVLKFSQHQDLLKRLLATEGIHLIEGNHWHDNVWGWCYCDACEGKEHYNMLGKILEDVRMFFRVQYDPI